MQSKNVPVPVSVSVSTAYKRGGERDICVTHVTVTKICGYMLLEGCDCPPPLVFLLSFFIRAMDVSTLDIIYDTYYRASSDA